MRTLVATLLALTAVLSSTGRAGAAPKEKLAALILRSGDVDEDLADNLTEVLIARLGRGGEREIAGKEELKTKLGVDDRAAAACMDNPSCIGRVGTELGVTRMVVGTLGRRGSDYLYNLNLVDIATGATQNRVFEMVAGGKIDVLIGAVQATADRIFQPKIEPGGVRVTSETEGALVYLDELLIGSAPVRRDGIEPGPHKLRVEKEGHLGWRKDIEVPAGSTLQVKVPLAALPERRRWPGTMATAFGVIAALDAAVGTVLYVLSFQAPIDSTITRREALDSANLRFLEGRVGGGLLLSGIGLGVTAAALAIKYRHEIFGAGPRDAKSTAARKKSLVWIDASPTRGGAIVEGGFHF